MDALQHDQLTTVQPEIVPDVSAPTEVHDAAHALLDFDPGETGTDSDYLRVASALGTLYKHGCLTSMVPALPLLLTLKGKAYSLQKHFPMEPLFTLRPHRTFVLKC